MGTDLNTGKGMYYYAKEHNYGAGFNDSTGIKHFTIIENNLLPDEKVLFTFIGLHNYVSSTKHDNNFAYALTNKRLLMAQKKIIGANLQTVYLDNINDIALTSGMLMGVLTVDTIKETFNVGMNKASVQAVSDELHRILNELRSSKQDTTVPTNTSDADEILKFKQLLDSGIITEEEFNQKKKQILGL